MNSDVYMDLARITMLTIAKRRLDILIKSFKQKHSLYSICMRNVKYHIDNSILLYSSQVEGYCQQYHISRRHFGEELSSVNRVRQACYKILEQ